MTVPREVTGTTKLTKGHWLGLIGVGEYLNSRTMRARLKGGRGDWIRTSDPLLPKQMRYQAALRPDCVDDTAARRGTALVRQSESPRPVTRSTSQSQPVAGGAERGRPARRGALSRDKRSGGEHPGVPAARSLRGGVAGWGCSASGPASG